MLTALLSRLYDVTEGAIRIDGLDIRDLSLAALRADGGHRVRGPDAVLDVGRREPRAGQAATRPTSEIGAGHRGRRRAVRLRPAVRARHPDRRAGHEPVRRPAAAAFAGPGDPGRAEDPGARRHAVGARRAHRGRRRGGAAPGAARGHRHRRRPPRLDRAAGRPGRPARGRHHHPRRHARRAAGRRARSTATCWPPTTNSTTAPSAAARGRTTRTAAGSAWPTRSRRRPTRPATSRTAASRRRRPRADDRDRHRPVDVPRPGRAVERWRGRFDEHATTTCRSTSRCRAGARPARCSGRCCGRTGGPSRCWPSSSWWKTLRGFRFRCSCSAASTTASRRSSTAGRRTRC